MTLCDIGNSTFSFFKDGKTFKLSLNSKLKKFPKVEDNLYFISVNKKATKRLLKKHPDAINCENMVDFKTTYKGLGLDRKIACIGRKNNIIVDCGSAITVDIMKDKKHLGGFILPGVRNFISFYPQISTKLKFNFTKDINLDKIPKNTNKAISYAILKSIILPIKELELKYNLPIIFTGEDSLIIKKYFKNSTYKKNLIFNTLKKIIKQGNKK